MAVPEEIARLEAADKTIGAKPWWYYDGPGEEHYTLSVPLAVGNVVVEGLYLEGSCHRWLPDRDVTFVMVYKPATGLAGPLARFDWKPLHSHENRGRIKGEWQWKRIKGTHVHPFDLNSPLGWERMARENLPIALPWPEPLNDFREMLESVGTLWKIYDIQSIPVPEWLARLT